MKKSDDFYADIRRKKLRRNAAGLLAGLLVLLIALGAGIWLRETLEPEPDIVTTSPPAPPEPTREELLLTEIRDILKQKN